MNFQGKSLPFLIGMYLTFLSGGICLAEKPFYIAPYVDFLNAHCENDASCRIAPEHKSITPISELIKKKLEDLEPGGPQGQVRVGYTLPINLFGLFRKVGNRFSFSPGAMQFFLDIAKKVGRPVVFDIGANHFVGSFPVTKWIEEEPESLAQLNDGQIVKEKYFSNGVLGFTFSQAMRLRINDIRFNGFAQAMRILASFERDNPQLVIGATIGGELHHLTRNMGDPKKMGEVPDIAVTDYSDASIHDFREYLKAKFSSVLRLNDEVGSHFPDFSKALPPKFDLRHRLEGPTYLHFDSFSQGKIPILGWLKWNQGDKVEIFLNGKISSEAYLGFNRLDVYEALSWNHRSDLGFRGELDYSGLNPGKHFLHVVLKRKNQKFLIGSRVFSVCSTGKNRNPFLDCNFDHPDEKPLEGLNRIPQLKGDQVPFSLDQPVAGEKLWFNPYAKIWQTFREKQVEDLVRRFSRLALDSGFPAQKLYTHFLASYREGSWNRVIPSIPNRALRDSEIGLGLNLYGDFHLYDLGQEALSSKYAVTEFHLRMGKAEDREQFYQAILYHKDRRAEFIAPYFLTVGSLNSTPENEKLMGLQISPDNSRYGSQFFYEAIVRAAKE